MERDTLPGDSSRFAPSGPSHCLLRPRLRGNLYPTGPSPYPCAGVHKPPGGYPFLRLKHSIKI